MIKFLILFLFLTSSALGNDLYTARELMIVDKYEEALLILKQLDYKENKEVLFYLGVAYEETLDNEMAMNYYSLFLENREGAERLRIGAWRRLQILISIKPNKMSDISQRMRYCSRKLGLKDTGADTQREQATVLRLLENMIKDEKKQESSSKSKSKSKSKPQPNNQSKKPSNKKSKAGETAGDSNNPNGKTIKIYSDGPQSPWNRLRDRSHDAANNAVKEKLPAKYRDIVEKYYDKVKDNE